MQLAIPLGLLALVAIPLILALYLLRPRPRRVLVSTVSLWQEALKESERSAGLRRLLKNLSLLLLLLTALLLALGLAGPRWLMSSTERADTVLVIDVSASMKARAGIGTTRFDQALAEARDIVNALPRGARMLVMTSGRKARLKSGFESERSVLRQVLAELKPTDEAGRPREALTLALSLLKGRDDGRVYFLTDGAFDPAADPGSGQIAYRIVGRPARNIAITRFDIRPERGSDDHYQLLLSVRNYTDAAVMAPTTVTLAGRTVFSRTIELEARGQQTIVAPLVGGVPGPASARIDIDDDLAADNTAYAAINVERMRRVLLVGAGNVYLQSVLHALPGLELVHRPQLSADEAAPLARQFDLVIFDGTRAPPLPPGNFLLINTVAPQLPFSDAGEVARPEILARGPSALMRGIDLSAVRIAAARRVSVQGEVPGLQRLFWSRETDLALALISGDVRLVYLGFDLAQSTLPVQVAFPLFIGNSLDWLITRGTALVPTHIAAGESHSIPAAALGAPMIMRTPAGRSVALEVKDGAATFDATGDAGIYQYRVGDATRYLAVSPSDARESDIEQRRLPTQGAEATQGAREGLRSFSELWPYFLGLALLLLLAEWGMVAWERRDA